MPLLKGVNKVKFSEKAALQFWRTFAESFDEIVATANWHLPPIARPPIQGYPLTRGNESVEQRIAIRTAQIRRAAI
jgi:hypothetical protein